MLWVASLCTSAFQSVIRRYALQRHADLTGGCPATPWPRRQSARRESQVRHLCGEQSSHVFTSLGADTRSGNAVATPKGKLHAGLALSMPASESYRLLDGPGRTSNSHENLHFSQLWPKGLRCSKRPKNLQKSRGEAPAARVDLRPPSGKGSGGPWRNGGAMMQSRQCGIPFLLLQSYGCIG